MAPPEKRKGRYKKYNEHGSTEPIPKRTLRSWKSAGHSKRRIQRRISVNDCSPDETLDEPQCSMIIEEGSSHTRTTMSLGDEQNSVGDNAVHSTEVCEGASLAGTTKATIADSPASQNADDDSDAPSGCTDDHSSDVYECLDNISDEEHNLNDDLSNLSTNGYKKETLIRALLVMATKIRHNLTYAAAEDVSRLLNAELNAPPIQDSKYHWKKMMKFFSAIMSVHHLCTTCGSYIGVQTVTDSETLHCCGCEDDIDCRSNIKAGNIFLYLSLTEQLAELFSRSRDSILYPVTRKKSNEYAIEDIYDGKLYKTGAAVDMISINFSVDGVPVFKSSNYSLYPILCSINELHPRIRRHNMILCSVWFGKGKPKMNEFLKPFVSESQSLYETGFVYNHNGYEYRKKCRVLVGVCDSVARPMVRNSTQFNGEYGCGLCLHRGEQVARGAGTTRVYSVGTYGNPHGEGLRNNEDTLKHAESQEKGMKGRSVICDVPSFNIVENLVADWMHCVALGVCRQFAKLWFNPVNHENEFYFGNMIPAIDCLLLSYKPTLEISRTPRKMSDRRHWKAHEWAIWLLFYSICTIKQHFPAKYVKHWSLLVDGIAILLKTSIFNSEILYAQNCLLEFAKDVEVLYGKEHVSFNVHLLTHLSQSVRNWGPLWTHSAFPYEDFNQDLLNFVKSSNGVAVQICDSFRLKCAVDRLHLLCWDEMTKSQRQYLSQILNKKTRPKTTLSVKGAQMIGEPLIQHMPRNHFLALRRVVVNIQQLSSAQYYKRALIHDELIHTADYCKALKRASHFVVLTNKEIFEILIFIVLSIQGDLQCYAIGNYWEINKTSLVKQRRLHHMVLIEGKIHDLAAVNVTAIKEKVTFVEMPILQMYVACMHPNHFELLT